MNAAISRVSVATSRLSGVVVLLMLGMAQAAHAIEPLTSEQQAVFSGSREDPPAAVLLGVSGQEGRHYVTGNEWNMQLFQPALANVGGGYIGVGSDQAYLMIGWQRPELAWLIDYDPLVVDVQRIYFALFAAAATPEAFLRLWDKDGKADAELAITRRWEKDKRLVDRLINTFRNHRAKIIKRLVRVKETVLAAGAATFLTDLATYTWVRDFVGSGRARAMVGDLLGKRGLRGIGAAATTLGVSIRVVYVSNAEQYWQYTSDFKKNLAALPLDEKSVLARTLLTWELNHDYRYNVQPMANFIAWLERPWVASIWQLIHRRKDDSKEPEFFVFDKDPDAEEQRLRAIGQLP